MSERKIKEFVFNALLLNNTFEELQKKGISVSRGEDFSQIAHVVENDFNPIIWNNAKNMSSVYASIYCIENTLRNFIVERLSERYGIDWWEQKVPAKIKEAVIKLKRTDEKNKYHSRRSEIDIGYTMFGNLGQIIISNWDDFSDIIPNQPWLTSRMDDLEMSRNVVMHTGMLPPDEIDRIENIVRDLLRQIG